MGKSFNKGQGKAGGKIATPKNIPADQGGTPAYRVPPIDNVMQSPKEETTDGIGGAHQGSNKSLFVL